MTISPRLEHPCGGSVLGGGIQWTHGDLHLVGHHGGLAADVQAVVAVCGAQEAGEGELDGLGGAAVELHRHGDGVEALLAADVHGQLVAVGVGNRGGAMGAEHGEA